MSGPSVRPFSNRMRFPFYFPASWRHLLLTGLLFSSSQVAWSQNNLGIGTATPDASALVEMQTSNKGLLTPRLTQAQCAAIASPATGLLVYQTDGAQPGFYYNAGTGGAPNWTRLNTGAAGAGDNLGNHTATQALNLSGHALVGTGNDLGTTIGVGVRGDGGLNLGQNNVRSVLLGYGTGNGTVVSGDNTYVGYNSGSATTTGYQNTFLGSLSGLATTTGSFNHFIGYKSGYNNQGGSQNEFLGYKSGYNNISGNTNTFLGFQSGMNNITGGNNVFVGSSTGLNTTGSNNLFVGAQSGSNNSTGSNNWAFGTNAGPNSGNLTNAGAIGYNAVVFQSNSLVLGGTGTDAVKVGIGNGAPSFTLDVNGSLRCVGAVNTTSDQRLKQDIRPLGGALAAVQQLRGVRYTFRRNEFPEMKLPAGEQVGVLAQEVERIYPELVSTDNKGYKAVNYAQLTPVLLEAIKEQQQQIEALKAQAVTATQRADQAARAEATQTADIQNLKNQLARLLGEAPVTGVASR